MNRLRSARRAVTIVGILVILAASALSAASAGGSRASSSATSGRKLFIANCASCHTLRDAGATGTDGGNLDKFFRHTKRGGIQGIVRRTIDNGASGMPRGILVDGDASAVAAYVGSVTGVAESSAKHCARFHYASGVTVSGATCSAADQALRRGRFPSRRSTTSFTTPGWRCGRVSGKRPHAHYRCTKGGSALSFSA